jgi:V/A-type H+/Na+-transporting ATPase subunit K
MNTSLFFAQLGMALAVGLAAVGSSLGAGVAGMSAAGAWAKDAKAGKALRFIYIVLVSAPITQTVYAFLVMFQMADKLNVAEANAGMLLGIGIATGLGEMLSAWMQGAIGAAGCRMLSDSDGKGFAFVLIALGIAETVGIFTLVFMSILLSTIKV